MNKLWSMIPMLLLGCNLTSEPPMLPEKEARPPVHMHSFVSTDNPVRYVCSQLEANEGLVWIRCEFLNVSDKPSELCLKIKYQSLLTDESVMGRKTCSGSLLGRKSSERFVAFSDKTWKEVNRLCGSLMDKCKMSAVEIEH